MGRSFWLSGANTSRVGGADLFLYLPIRSLVCVLCLWSSVSFARGVAGLSPSALMAYCPAHCWPINLCIDGL